MCTCPRSVQRRERFGQVRAKTFLVAAPFLLACERSVESFLMRRITSSGDPVTNIMMSANRSAELDHQNTIAPTLHRLTPFLFASLPGSSATVGTVCVCRHRALWPSTGRWLVSSRVSDPDKLAKKNIKEVVGQWGPVQSSTYQ